MAVSSIDLLRFDFLQGKDLLLALSGGADSVALMHILLKRKDEDGFRISCAHLHHGIRGKDADADAAFCKSICESAGVKLICGLFVAQEGKVLINGTDSREFNRDEYYKLFSTLFQDVSLLPSTIEKNIALCEESRIDRLKLKKCMTLAGIADKVESLPDKEKTLLVREVHEGATALSGGELQRLLLARALYKDAPIIILDEPTAALDPIAENDMYLKYNELTEGKTAIYISHRLSSTRFCDRIILLDESKIAEIGTHEELLDLGGKYAEMFKIQSKYYREGEAV